MATAAKVKVTICGGGSGAHTLAGISSMNDQFSVTVLNNIENKAERWTTAMAKNGFTINLANGGSLKQLPGEVKFKVTSDVPQVVTTADVVIIVAPAYAHEVYLEFITQHLSNEALVVGMPGQPGFEYQCLHYLKKYEKKCAVMALETLPWACRINEYGHDVTVFGFKDKVQVSLIQQGSSTLDPLATIQKILGEAPILKQASHVLEMCMMTKVIVHPLIMYTQWKNWNGEEIESPPLFYQGVDDRAIEYIDGASNELFEVSEKLKKLYPQFKGMYIGTIKNWMLEHYCDQITDKSTLLTTLRTNTAYEGLVHPMTKTSSGKYVPNFAYRYLREDIPYGVLIQRAVAEMLEVKTPVIDEIITWVQCILGTEFLVDGKINQNCKENTRIPQRYGLFSIEDLLQYCESK